MQHFVPSRLLMSRGMFCGGVSSHTQPSFGPAQIAVGIAPTLILPWTHQAFYIAWREAFIFNSQCWCLLRYVATLYGGTLAASSLPVGHIGFFVKALVFGPYAPVLLLGIGYPLRVQAAFPFSCAAGVGATAGAFWVHVKLSAVAAVKPHLAHLAKKVCSSVLYNELVHVFTGNGCVPETVLLNLWCAQSGLAVMFLLLFIMKGESKRRRRFLELTGYWEPFPLFWNENFALTAWIVFLAVPTVLGLEIVLSRAEL